MPIDRRAEEEGVADVVAVPDVRQLEPLQLLLHFENGEEVGDHLGGVLEVAEGVHGRNSGELRELVHDLLGVDPCDDGVQVVAEYPRGVLDGLPAAELQFVGREIERVAAEPEGRDLEARPRPSGRLLEEQADHLPFERNDILPRLDLSLEKSRSLEQGAELLCREVCHRKKASHWLSRLHGRHTRAFKETGRPLIVALGSPWGAMPAPGGWSRRSESSL